MPATHPAVAGGACGTQTTLTSGSAARALQPECRPREATGDRAALQAQQQGSSL